MHPNAAIRPRTAVRRLLLIQAELRQQENNNSQAKRLRARQQALRQNALVLQARCAAQVAAHTKAIIAEHVKEFEETLAGILAFEAQHEKDTRDRQQARAVQQGLQGGQGVQGVQGLSHGTWLTGVRKTSLVDSIVNRVCDTDQGEKERARRARRSVLGEGLGGGGGEGGAGGTNTEMITFLLKILS